ncbi:MAG TPA: hypothetical protein VIH58_06735 [Chthoniobacterales bacterium]|jgi:hypothetical protein
MAYSKNSKSRFFQFALCSLLVVTMLAAEVAFAIPPDTRKTMTIDATAMGTSTQLGQVVNVKVTIYEFSTEEDRAILIEAFKQGKQQGLVNALTKMKAVGRIAITGTLGYDLSFIRLIPTPTGRKIRFITNRQIRFGEAYYNTRSRDYDLTGGEIEINDSDKEKSGGILYPATKFVINKDGQLEFQLFKNPWKLTNIIDWDKAGKPE